MLHFIVDGYNLINRVKLLKPLTLQAKRESLLTMLASFKNNISPRNKVTVVFDGSKDVFSQERGFSGIKVIFSRDEDADNLIKRFMDKADNPKEVLLITDDKEIIRHSCKRGVQHMNTTPFLRWLKAKRPSEEEDNFKADVRDVDKVNTELRQMWKKKYK